MPSILRLRSRSLDMVPACPISPSARRSARCNRHPLPLLCKDAQGRNGCAVSALKTGPIVQTQEMMLERCYQIRIGSWLRIV